MGFGTLWILLEIETILKKFGQLAMHLGKFGSDILVRKKGSSNRPYWFQGLGQPLASKSGSKGFWNFSAT